MTFIADSLRAVVVGLHPAAVYTARIAHSTHARSVAGVRRCCQSRCVMLGILLVAGCASATPALSEAAHVFGNKWQPSEPNKWPSFPPAARASGAYGLITFAVLLDNDDGAVDRNVLSVLSVSDSRLLPFACRWMERTRFFSADSMWKKTGRNALTAIAIEYDSAAMRGRLVEPSVDSWQAIGRVRNFQALKQLREGAVQCP